MLNHGWIWRRGKGYNCHSPFFFSLHHPLPPSSHQLSTMFMKINKNFAGMCDYNSTTSRRAYAHTAPPTSGGDLLREIQADKNLRDAFGKFDVVSTIECWDLCVCDISPRLVANLSRALLYAVTAGR